MKIQQLIRHQQITAPSNESTSTFHCRSVTNSSPHTVKDRVRSFCSRTFKALSNKGNNSARETKGVLTEQRNNKVKEKVSFFERKRVENKDTLAYEIIERGLKNELANAPETDSGKVVFYNRPQELVDAMDLTELHNELPSFKLDDLKDIIRNPALNYHNLASDINAWMKLHPSDYLGVLTVSEGNKCIDVELANGSKLKMRIDNTKKEIHFFKVGDSKEMDQDHLESIKQLSQKVLADYQLNSDVNKEITLATAPCNIQPIRNAQPRLKQILFRKIL